MAAIQIRVLKHVHLVGRKHTAAKPARFNAHQVIGVDEADADLATYKASPNFFTPADPKVAALWAQERAAKAAEKAAAAAVKSVAAAEATA